MAIPRLSVKALALPAHSNRVGIVAENTDKPPLASEQNRQAGKNDGSYCPFGSPHPVFGGTVSPLVTRMVADPNGSFVVALAIGAGVTMPGVVSPRTVVRAPISSQALDGGEPPFVPIAGPV